jgi:hypothetical protein
LVFDPGHDRSSPSNRTSGTTPGTKYFFLCRSLLFRSRSLLSFSLKTRGISKTHPVLGTVRHPAHVTIASILAQLSPHDLGNRLVFFSFCFFVWSSRLASISPPLSLIVPLMIWGNSLCVSTVLVVPSLFPAPTPSLIPVLSLFPPRLPRTPPYLAA